MFALLASWYLSRPNTHGTHSQHPTTRDTMSKYRRFFWSLPWLNHDVGAGSDITEKTIIPRSFKVHGGGGFATVMRTAREGGIHNYLPFVNFSFFNLSSFTTTCLRSELLWRATFRSTIEGGEFIFWSSFFLLIFNLVLRRFTSQQVVIRSFNISKFTGLMVSYH